MKYCSKITKTRRFMPILGNIAYYVGNGWGCTGVGYGRWWGCRWVQSEAYLLWRQTKWVLGRLIHLFPEGSSTPSTTS